MADFMSALTGLFGAGGAGGASSPFTGLFDQFQPNRQNPFKDINVTGTDAFKGGNPFQGAGINIGQVAQGNTGPLPGLGSNPAQQAALQNLSDPSIEDRLAQKRKDQALKERLDAVLKASRQSLGNSRAKERAEQPRPISQNVSALQSRGPLAVAQAQTPGAPQRGQRQGLRGLF